MTIDVSLPSLVLAAKRAVAAAFLDVKPNHGISRKQLVAELRKNGILWQVATTAIDELLRNKQLLTPSQRWTEIQKRNQRRKNAAGQEILISKEEQPIVVATYGCPQDGLIANNSLQDLLGLERPSSTIKPTDNGDSRRLAGTCNKHMEAEITVNLQTVKGWTARQWGKHLGYSASTVHATQPGKT